MWMILPLTILLPVIQKITDIVRFTCGRCVVFVLVYMPVIRHDISHLDQPTCPYGKDSGRCLRFRLEASIRCYLAEKA